MTNSPPKTREVYLIDGARTPFLKAKSTPGPFKAADLAVAAGRPLLERQPFKPSDLDEVILGCMIPAADEANIGRVVSLRLGCGKKVPGWTVQRNCASGMQAVDSALKDIQSGRANLVLAGGTEAMSHSPVMFNHGMVTWLGKWMKAKNIMQKIAAITQFRPSMLAPEIALLKGLRDPIVGLSMGQTTEVIADKFGITRTQMDEYATRSHKRLAAAIDEGRLANEIEIAIDGDGRYYDVDDGLRRDSSVERLAKLRSIFDRPYGKVTAGNSSQVTDGSAWCLLASEEAV
ncbi:MAG: acetyl-CoA C-acetyltransferase, partial [Gammaproteobacteria bacterium]